MIRTPLRGTIYMQCGSRTWRLEEELGGAHLRPNQRSRQGVRPFCMCADCSNVLKVWLLVYAEVTWLLIIHINLLSAVGLGAILAPIPMLHLRSTLLGDISPSIPSKPVQATTWYTLSIVVPATRFTSERQEDAWEIDSESTCAQHDKATLIFLWVDILHHQNTPLLICCCL